MATINFDSLIGAQKKAVIAAIVSAFTEAELEALLATDLDVKLANLAAAAPWSIMAFKVVEASQRDGFTGSLVEAICAAKPRNPLIRDLPNTLRLVVPTGAPALKSGGLEKLLREKSRIVGFEKWLSGLTAIQGSVCRVEGLSMGTGFLIGPDLILTNYHVVEAEIKAPAQAANIVCRFDFSTLNGVEKPGSPVKLAAHWLVASAPYAQADISASNAAPSDDELDFAVLRLAEVVGAAAPAGGKRNCIALSRAAPKPAPQDVVFIVQHPKGAPLSMASGTVSQLAQGGRRMRYDADTESGSSGSPVFDADLALVALHHAGDPAWSAKYNEGIPAGLIADNLLKQGVSV